MKERDGKLAIVLVYVDDLIITGDDEDDRTREIGSYWLAYSTPLSNPLLFIFGNLIIGMDKDPVMIKSSKGS